MAKLQPMGIRAVAERVGEFNKKVGSMNNSIATGNKAMGQAQKESRSLGKTLRTLGAAAGVATAAFLAVRKALAFGREGALLTQTGESFDFLIKKIGAAPDLLDQLTAASKGTISELGLMSSTATLLAGVGDDLALMLADATPKLMEIAKAANKLNPNLGTTAFMYQSIATGVKRAQPLILDNLGITIKVGEANREFAESIGKTVDELTAEEKAMAILLGTLKAGDNLIQQVGGTTDSATDSYDRLGVAFAVSTDAAKMWLNTALVPVVNKMATALEVANDFRDAIADLGFTVGKFGLVYDDAGDIVAMTTDEIIDAAAANREWLATIDSTVIDGWSAGIRQATGDTVVLSEKAEEAAEDFERLWQKATPDASKMIEQASKYISYMESTMPAVVEEIGKTADAYQKGEQSGKLAIDAMEELAIASAAAILESGGELKDANEQLANDLGISSQEAGRLLQVNYISKLDKLDGRTIIINIVERITTERESVQTGLETQMGFQHGGRFVVGGRPGIDTNLVQFRATRGEVVTVTPTSNVDNRSVNMGDVNIGGGAMSPTSFDRMMRDWLGD